MDIITLQSQPRTITGKKTKQLRAKGVLPVVIFSAGNNSINAQVEARAFEKVLKAAGHSTLVDVTFEGKTFKIIIDEVQYDPRTRKLEHAMLNKVNLKEEITAEVPIQLIGEAPAVKIEKGILVTPVIALEVRCLPTDLPQHIEVDVSNLAAIGDAILVSDITLPKGVKLLHEDELASVLVTATPPQKEEVEIVAETEPTETIEPELSVERGKKEEEAE